MGLSETNKIKPKKAPKPLFYWLSPPNTFLRYCKGLSDPKATPPYWCFQVEAISTLKTPSVVSWESQKPVKSSPKRLPNTCFTQLSPPNTSLRYCKGLSDPQATPQCWCCQVEAISTLKTPSVGSWDSQKPIKSSQKRLPNPCPLYHVDAVRWRPYQA